VKKFKGSRAVATTMDADKFVTHDTRFTLLAKPVVEVEFLLDLPASKVQVGSAGSDDVFFAVGDDDPEVCVKDYELPLLVEALQAYLRVKKIAP